MDVHPPHTPIHGLRDFLIHLLTITAGLLIALGLEAAVEHFHHEHQLSEARESIHAELARNREELEKIQPPLQKQLASIDAMLGICGSVRAHRAAADAPRLDLVGVSLSRASWETAQSSGVLTLMPYSEASRLASAYQVQGIFDQIQVQTITAMAPLMGALPSPNTLNGIEALSPAALDSLEEKLRTGRGESRVMAAAAGELDKKYKTLDGN